jgi:vacuolar-type H+-ATPase subunit E/Vma4
VADEGQLLLAQLDDDRLETRERARRLLASLYDQYKDKIEQTLQDKSASAEVRAQLTRIVSEESESRLVRQTIEALSLLNDPQYVVSFLEDAEPRESVSITHYLESLTGKKLGPDAAAWKDWLKANDGIGKSE